MEHTLGKRIMTARKELGLTQEQLAEQLGVTAQAVSKWEHDQSCPDISMLPKLAEIFHTSTDALLGCTAQPSTSCDPETSHSPEAPKPPKARKHKRDLHPVYFSLLVLLCGCILVASRLLSWNISVWDILWPCGLLIYGICRVSSGLMFLRLGCILFGGYFLLNNLNVIDLQLGTELVLPVIIVLLGLSLLIKALHSARPSSSTHQELQLEQNGFTFIGSFGEAEQIISLELLKHGTIDTRFGQYTINLSGVQSIADHCRLQVNSKFGHLILIVPHNFEVCIDSHSTFSHVSTIGEPSEITGRVTMNAKANFGQIEIRYI